MGTEEDRRTRRAALKASGYRVSARLLDAQWLGVPQRIIFVGVREDLHRDPVHPVPLRYRYSVRDTLPHLTACKTVAHGYKSPDYWILKTLAQHIESGQSVMLLASCSFMLHPVISVLRQWGIPFHNPYRKSAGYWNPLRRRRKGSSANRILTLPGPDNLGPR